MFRGRTLWPALACDALFVACTAQETADAMEEATVAEAVDLDAIAAAIDAVEADYIAAYNAGDATGIAALFAEDGRQSPPLSPALDKAGIEAAYAQTLAEGSFALEVDREDFITSGDMVASWGTFTATVTPPEGDPVVTSGRYGVVSRLQADGSWKIYRHMFNYEVPPPGFGQ